MKGRLRCGQWRVKNGAKTVVLLQLLRQGAMSKALDYIKAALQIAFSLVVLAIIY
ncbi:MAG TPA: hypothetical protein VIH87_10405 [Methylocella sp.]